MTADLDFFSSQFVLFEQLPKRLKLLSLPKNNSKNILKVKVHRNHSFEMISSVINYFLNLSKIKASFEYSDYDDSLNFSIKKDYDLNLVWLDLSRYNNEINLNDWLIERVKFLRSKVKSPILLINIGEVMNGVDDLQKELPEFYYNCINVKTFPQNNNFFDDEKAHLSGTRLSDIATILTARKMGTHWIPSIFLPTMKALVLDLDNTLYQGVLGEDGINGIKLTSEHLKLQKAIKSFKENGLFLAVCSKNEEEDVIEMFNQRTDFPLGLEDFATYQINWNSKAENILKIREKLRIGFDSMIFIDDNAGELFSVSNEIENINMIFASNDVTNTISSLENYPRLFKWYKSKTDKLRNYDLKSNDKREDIKQNVKSFDEYFEILGTKLKFNIDDKSQIDRISELSKKTNQFNLSYNRYDRFDVDKFLNSSNYCIITVSLRDKLSDSGLIGIVIAKISKSNNLIIDELCISCRALGRNLEDFLILKSFEIIKDRLKAKAIHINYKREQRNQPALKWLNRLSEKRLETSGNIIVNSLKVPSYGKLKYVIRG